MMVRKTGFYIVKPSHINDWMACNEQGYTVCLYSEPETTFECGTFTFSGVPDDVACYEESFFSFVSNEPIDLNPQILMASNEHAEISWTELSRESLRKGWYAVHYGWASGEGSWVKALYFDGVEFDEDLPIAQISESTFTSEELAQNWADRNDISI